MNPLNAREAKRRLPRLVKRVALGESFTITKSGKPIARLLPLDTDQQRNRFVFGCMAGEIKMADEFEVSDHLLPRD